MILVLTLAALPSLAQAFFTLGGCSCPQPSCPPVAPQAVCAPAPQPVCPQPAPCGAVVHGAKIEAYPTAVTLPDELEMRAAAFGVPVNGPQHSPSNIEQLERLVDRYDEPLRESTDLPFVSETETMDDATTPAETTTTETTTVAAATSAPSESSTIKEEETTQSKCNSQVLHKMMLDNMSDNSAESKRKINEAAEGKFGGNVDVICSRGHFSYVFSSNLFCEATKGLLTCIAFRQAS